MFFNISGSVQDLPKATRSRVTAQAQDNRMRTQHVRDRFRRISSQTVIEGLSEHEIRARRPCVGPQLLPRHRPARLQWRRAHLAWQARQWNWVLFYDESRFFLDGSDGLQHVNRRPGERFTDACVAESDIFRGGVGRN